MANRRLRKEILEAARGLYELGAIGGKTMREFESLRVAEPRQSAAIASAHKAWDDYKRRKKGAA